MTDTRRAFHTHLEEIGSDIVQLAGMVEEGLPKVTDALLANDHQIAKVVIDGDEVLDRLTLSIEDRVCHLLATQQPMASDLRTLVTALHLIGELERSGDLVVNVAKAIQRIGVTVDDPQLRGLIGDLSTEALALLRQAVDSYVDHDDAAAAALDAMDDRLDDLHRQYIERLIEVSRAHELDVQPAVQLALVGRYYERIGDHAVNIGERVRYLVSGWLPIDEEAE